MRTWSPILTTLLSLSLLSHGAPFLGSQDDHIPPETQQVQEFISSTLYVKEQGRFAPTLANEPLAGQLVATANGLPDTADDDAIALPEGMTLDDIKARLMESPLLDVAPVKKK